jgi:hypothetical protein
VQLKSFVKKIPLMMMKKVIVKSIGVKERRRALKALVIDLQKGRANKHHA